MRFFKIFDRFNAPYIYDICALTYATKCNAYFFWGNMDANFHINMHYSICFSIFYMSHILTLPWMSKLRYGLQFLSQVRNNQTDPINQNMKSIQVAQNKMLRMLEGVSLKDHDTSSSLLKKHNIPSVNQLSGEIKLLEAWKSINIPNYSFKLIPNNKCATDSDRALRITSIKVWKDTASSKVGVNSFCMDTAKLWNNAPTEIKNAKTIGTARNAIKKFTRTLEI